MFVNVRFPHSPSTASGRALPAKRLGGGRREPATGTSRPTAAVHVHNPEADIDLDENAI